MVCLRCVPSPGLAAPRVRSPPMPHGLSKRDGARPWRPAACHNSASRIASAAGLTAAPRPLNAGWDRNQKWYRLYMYPLVPANHHGARLSPCLGRSGRYGNPLLSWLASDGYWRCFCLKKRLADVHLSTPAGRPPAIPSSTSYSSQRDKSYQPVARLQHEWRRANADDGAIAPPPPSYLLACSDHN